MLDLRRSVDELVGWDCLRPPEIPSVRQDVEGLALGSERRSRNIGTTSSDVFSLMLPGICSSDALFLLTKNIIAINRARMTTKAMTPITIPTIAPLSKLDGRAGVAGELVCAGAVLTAPAAPSEPPGVAAIEADELVADVTKVDAGGVAVAG